MKPIALTLISSLVALTTSHATDFYLQSNVSTGSSYNTKTVWFDQQSGGGNNPTVFGGNDFFLNGFDLRSGASSTGATTFSGRSLNFEASSELMDLMAPTVNLNNTVNASNGTIRVHSSRDAVTLNVGTLNAAGNGISLRAPGASDVLTLSVTTLTGSGDITFGNTSGTDSGNYSISAVDASTFMGRLLPNDGELSLGTNASFGEAVLFLDTSFGATVNIANAASFGTISGTTFSDIPSGVYTAAQLNTLTGSSIFTGGENITVGVAIPEPSQGLFAVPFLAYAFLRRRR